MVATPSPNLGDQQLLATDPTFQARVREAVIATCFSIASEAVTESTLAIHRQRMQFGVQTLFNLVSSSQTWTAFFAQCVATDSATINAATVNGATPLTGANVAAQAAVIPDSDIVNALSAQWNAFFNP